MALYWHGGTLLWCQIRRQGLPQKHTHLDFAPDAFQRRCQGLPGALKAAQRLQLPFLLQLYLPQPCSTILLQDIRGASTTSGQQNGLWYCTTDMSEQPDSLQEMHSLANAANCSAIIRTFTCQAKCTNCTVDLTCVTNCIIGETAWSPLV